MPLTPLHYPLAHGLSKVGKKLSLPGLVVGAVIPDIEVPLMRIFFSDLPDHLVLHSLIGAATLGKLQIDHNQSNEPNNLHILWC